VKIQNNQPYSGNFAIDPRYFSNAFDRLAQGATARFTRTVSTSPPLNGDVTGESVPGGAVPTNADLETWAAWAQDNYRSNWHPIGTVAMMSQDLGGSVDSSNKVVGSLLSNIADRYSMV
jgi:choline dehydrogenase-like flavoprotein